CFAPTLYCYPRLQYNEEMRDEKGLLFYSRVSFGSSARLPAFTGRLKYATQLSQLSELPWPVISVTFASWTETSSHPNPPTWAMAPAQGLWGHVVPPSFFNLDNVW
ncbi:MAG: hypothetical protein Q8O86_01725, partial [Dehalococcoidia bacterium]|nr:hypothetical protein [Dehalococcoidia bacterium]